MKPLVIVGAGGQGRVVLDAAQAAGMDVAGMLVDGASGTVNGVAVLGGFDRLQGDFLTAHSFVVAIGDQAVRRALATRLRADGVLVSVIHPNAWVSPHAVIGQGTTVSAGAVVNANAQIGDFCIINTGSSVDHDCRLADGVQICPGARLVGGVVCEEDVFVGTGAIVIPGRTIGTRTVVGAGAVVIRDLGPDLIAVGNPARAK